MPVHVFSLSGSNVNKSERDKHLVFFSERKLCVPVQVLVFSGSKFSIQAIS